MQPLPTPVHTYTLVSLQNPQGTCFCRLTCSYLCSLTLRCVSALSPLPHTRTHTHTYTHTHTHTYIHHDRLLRLRISRPRCRTCTYLCSSMLRCSWPRQSTCRSSACRDVRLSALRRGTRSSPRNTDLTYGLGRVEWRQGKGAASHVGAGTHAHAYACINPGEAPLQSPWGTNSMCGLREETEMGVRHAAQQIGGGALIHALE